MRVSLSEQAKVACFLVLAFVGCTGLGATEPYAYARILSEWDETGENLKLSIIPDRALRSATLRLEIPETISLEPDTGKFDDRFQERVVRDRFRVLEAGLGEIPARSVLDLSFRRLAGQAQGGVVSFILEGETAQGDKVREAIGVVVGYPGKRPVRRHGALEFPAVPLPEEPQ